MSDGDRRPLPERLTYCRRCMSPTMTRGLRVPMFGGRYGKRCEVCERYLFKYPGKR